jgi:ribonuclease HI
MWNRLLLVSPRGGGASFEFAYPIDPDCINNQAKYLTILRGIKLLKEVKADIVEIFGDLQLVVNQLISKYECNNEVLLEYFEE